MATTTGATINTWPLGPVAWKAALLVAVALALPMHGAAQESERATSLRVGLIHTDNVALAEEGFEESQAVLEVSPAFALQRETNRFDSALSYRAQGLFYEDSENDEVFHQLAASALVGVLPERLFLRTTATYDQTIIDPEQSFSSSNVSITENRTNVALLEVAPYVLITGQSKSGVFELRKERVDYRDEALQDLEVSGAVFTLGTDRESGAIWALDYGYEEYDYELEVTPTIKFHHFEVNLGYWVSRGLQLFSIQGIENDFRKISEDDLEERYWEGGILFEPSVRSSFLITAGKRLFGETARLAWTQDMRRGTFTMSYTESPDSLARNLLSSAQQVDESVSFEDLLNFAGDTDVYVDKTFSTGFELRGARSTMSLTFYDERREDWIDSETGAELGDQDQHLRGYSFNFLRTLSVGSSLRFLVQRAKAQYQTDGRRGRNQQTELLWERRVGRRGTLILSGAHDVRSGNIGGNYRENRAQAVYSYDF